ncbi:ATP-dependent endonuclease, partial [Klebsiella pneumoniae]|uniref:ATP-dependent endonuclease n=3 Tax=Enterobacteriaceae TaxID=543 RepID=UPI00115CB01F
AMGINLDQLGITICNVAGVNFEPYVKLAASLGLPFSVITDWDPLDGTKQPMGKTRSIGIWQAFSEVSGKLKKLLPENINWLN